jgi:hypothetical protein
LHFDPAVGIFVSDGGIDIAGILVLGCFDPPAFDMNFPGPATQLLPEKFHH